MIRLMIYMIRYDARKKSLSGFVSISGGKPKVFVDEKVALEVCKRFNKQRLPGVEYRVVGYVRK